MTSGEPVMSTEVGREIELHEFFEEGLSHVQGQLHE